MRLKDYDSLIEIPLKNKWKAADYPRIRAHYQDALSMAQMVHELEKAPFALGTTQSIEHSNKISSCLKALFHLSAVYFSVVLHELSKRPPRASSLQIFVQKPTISNNNRRNQLLGAYCVELYRHKLVTHHDCYRIGGSTRSPDGIWRLRPTTPSLSAINALQRELTILKTRFGPKIQGLPKENNLPEIAKLLFYGIPLPTAWTSLCDRKRINNVVEEIGCASMSSTEVVTALDAFSKAIIKFPKSSFL